MARGILSTVLAEATRRGARAVRSVEVRVGELEGVDPDALRAAFDLEAAGTRAQGAALAIAVTPIRLACSWCGLAWDLPVHDDAPIVCPRCAAPARVEGARGVVIERATLSTSD